MDGHGDIDETALPGCGSAFLALAASGVLVAAAIAATTGLGPFYPFVLIVTLGIVGVLGSTAFLLLRENPTGPKVALFGVVTGATLPALLGLSLLADPNLGLPDYLAFVGGFAGAGVLGGFAVWLFVIWLGKGGWYAKAGLGAIIAAGIAGMWLVPEAYVDRSCHNPLRDGRTSIGPVAGFELRAEMSDWESLRDELEAFSREDGWDAQTYVRLDPDFPWFDASLCRETGTVLSAMSYGLKDGTIAVSVMQPQGGGGWQPPLRKLQDRLERRWPGRIEYDYADPGIAPPPWAPPKPHPPQPAPHKSPAPTGSET